MTARRSFTCFVLVLLAQACAFTNLPETTTMAADNQPNSTKPGEPASAGVSSKPATPAKLETATFGEGCFWCSEAVYQRLRGVKSVVSGYSGGNIDKPTYEQVCTGKTGHAE